MTALIPKLGVVTDIRVDTPDVKTFRVEAIERRHMLSSISPGQCAMLSIPGVGEAMFSITSSPTMTEYQEFSIKKCGCLTSWLHQMEPGQQITIRGPYGNGFPVETDLKGKDLLFIAGGVGLAPLHSVINYVLDNRADYRHRGRASTAPARPTICSTLTRSEEWSCDEEGHQRPSDHRPRRRTAGTAMWALCRTM